jgi:2,3-bisphosphoglycerate-dependent phosphoglycerate mutase
MLLYVIRHAQSANNALYTRTGGSAGRQADPPLTEVGHRQAQLLAAFLAAAPPEPRADAPPLIGEYSARHDRRGFGLTHLYCSLMTRAIQTAGYVAEATGLPLTALAEIHERGGLHEMDEATGQDTGVAGPNRAWFQAEFPHLLLPEELDEVGWWNRPMETVEEAVPRARAVWAGLLAHHRGTADRVAVFTHAGFFQSLMTALFTTGDSLSAPHLGAPLMGFGMSNTAVSRFEIDAQSIIVRYLNRIDFLPDELITG